MKRTLKYGTAALILCVAAFYAYVTRGRLLIEPYFEQREARRLLSTASSPQQLQHAVGPRGAFYTFPDGSWLAIRYQDSHGGGIWSVATARDSGGNWYESREHFCGAFNIIRDFEAIDRELGTTGSPPADPPEDIADWIQLLAASPDLPTARLRMRNYFHPIQ